jgi:hypothetical protein
MVLKKLERKISWDLYLTAFVISLVIFGVGIWVGLQIEQEVNSQLIQNIQSTNNKMLLLSNLLLLENDSAFCKYIEKEMSVFDDETYQIGKQIGFMEEKRGIDEDLKKIYMELEFRDYLLSKKINEKCNSKQNIILYFVSSSNCSICKEQGEKISAAKEGTNTRVYTFDIDIESELISSLLQKYNISRTPSIIINDKIYSGHEEVITTEEIKLKLVS